MEKKEADALSVSVDSEKSYSSDQPPSFHSSMNDVRAPGTPPPAYKKPKSTAIEIAKIVAITFLAATFILGVFIVAAAWLQARASCVQFEKSSNDFVSEPLVEIKPPETPAAVSETPAAVSETPAAVTETPPQEEQKLLKLPLSLTLDDVAQQMLTNHMQTDMKCVMEKKKIENIVDKQPKDIRLPFGINVTTDSRFQQVTGERMVIKCQSGDDKNRGLPDSLMDILATLPQHLQMIKIMPQNRLHPFGSVPMPPLSPHFHHFLPDHMPRRHFNRGPMPHGHFNPGPMAHEHSHPRPGPMPHGHSHPNPMPHGHSHPGPMPHGHSHPGPMLHGQSHPGPMPHEHSHLGDMPHDHPHPDRMPHNRFRPDPKPHNRFRPDPRPHDRVQHRDMHDLMMDLKMVNDNVAPLQRVPFIPIRDLSDRPIPKGEYLPLTGQRRRPPVRAHKLPPVPLHNDKTARVFSTQPETEIKVIPMNRGPSSVSTPSMIMMPPNPKSRQTGTDRTATLAAFNSKLPLALSPLIRALTAFPFNISPNSKVIRVVESTSGSQEQKADGRRGRMMTGEAPRLARRLSVEDPSVVPHPSLLDYSQHSIRPRSVFEKSRVKRCACECLC